MAILLPYLWLVESTQRETKRLGRRLPKTSIAPRYSNSLWRSTYAFTQATVFPSACFTGFLCNLVTKHSPGLDEQERESSPPPLSNWINRKKPGPSRVQLALL